jgi:hypothetical protein
MTKRKQLGQKTLSSFYLDYNKRRKVIFIFQHGNMWYCKLFRGFTHVILGWRHENGLMTFVEPCDKASQVLSLDGNWYNHLKSTLKISDKMRVLEVAVNVTRESRLIHWLPKRQSCTTIVQYLVGISLGVVTPQGLYDKLTKKDSGWLKERGIMEVIEWEES